MAIISIYNTKGDLIADVNSKEVLKDVIDIALIGRGAESYIEDLNQNFISILERLASIDKPENPIVGEMWFDLNTNSLKIFNGQEWELNVENIANMSSEEIKNWVLGFIDLSNKFNKSGGTIYGNLIFNDVLNISGNILVHKNETSSIGSYDKRFKTLYIRDDSIYLGNKGKYHINKNSFIYVVDSNDADVSNVPPGSIIMNKKTGIALVKKLNGTFNDKNAKFGQLLYDINNAIRLGYEVRQFLGDRAVQGRGWKCGWAPNEYNHYQISTPMNAKFFGTPRKMTLSPIGVTGGMRGLFHTGGWPGHNWSSTFEYITFSTPSNGQFFGNAKYRAVEAQGVSDGTRGVFSGGWNGWWGARNDIEYVTIQTPMNSLYFGSAWQGRKYSATHISDGIKGVNAGGHKNWNWWGRFNNMDYITISTPSNGLYFGQLRWRRWCNAGNTDGESKGFIFGGWWAPRGSIEVVRISTPSNSSYFGNSGNWFSHSSTETNGIYITLSGGWGYGWCGWRQIRRFNTKTPSNASYFGNMRYHLHHFNGTSGN
jgi:hypothetical protein